MGLFNRSERVENSLVVDIGSGSTGAALVRSREGKLPEIVAIARTPFFSKGEPSAETLESDMLASLRTTLARVSGKLAPIDKTLLSFSSPWAVTHLKNVIIAKEQPFSFDEKMMKAIVSEERELFRMRLAEDFSEECEIFESAITSIFLNGYETHRALGERVNRVEMSFLLSAAPKALMAKVEIELGKHAGVRKGLAITSFMYAYYKVLSHSFINLHSALLVNMTHEMTDMLFLRHGSSAVSASLPFGPSSIVRAVAQKLGVPEEIARSYLSLFASGAFDAATSQAVEAVIMEVESKWKSMWQSTGEGMPDASSVPYSVYLVAPAGYEKLIKSFLESVLSGRRVVVLGETNAFTKELASGGDEELGDESLLLLASFSNMLK